MFHYRAKEQHLWTHPGKEFFSYLFICVYMQQILFEPPNTFPTQFCPRSSGVIDQWGKQRNQDLSQPWRASQSSRDQGTRPGSPSQGHPFRPYQSEGAMQGQRLNSSSWISYCPWTWRIIPTYSHWLVLSTPTLPLLFGGAVWVLTNQTFRATCNIYSRDLPTLPARHKQDVPKQRMGVFQVGRPWFMCWEAPRTWK